MSSRVYSNTIAVTTQFYFCSNALKVDTYKGCSHGCEYCFANRPKGSGNPIDFFSDIAPGDLRPVFSAFKRACSSESSSSAVVCLLRKKQPLHVGGMSDPFQPCEVRYGVTGKLIEFLSNNKYPAIFSTKGRAVLNFKNKLKEAGSCVQISLMAADALKKIEPSAPPYEERLEIIKELVGEGIPVVIRAQPMISQLLGEFLSVLEKLKDTKIEGVTVEGLKFGRSASKDMRGLCEYLGYDPFLLLSKTGEGVDKEYPDEIKLQYIRKIKEKCRSLGFKFFVADNNFRDLGDHWNCCGFNDVKGYDQVNRCQLSPLLEKETFSFDDLETDKFLDCDCKGLVSNDVRSGYFVNHSTRKIFMQNFFNKNKGNCVIKTFPRAIPVGISKNKNVIYKVKKLKD